MVFREGTALSRAKKCWNFAGFSSSSRNEGPLRSDMSWANRPYETGSGQLRAGPQIFLFRANSLLGLGSVQHFQSHLARLVRACACGPSRFELQISFQILQLLPIIPSPRIHVRQHEVCLGESRFPQECFARASLSLIQSV